MLIFFATLIATVAFWYLWRRNYRDNGEIWGYLTLLMSGLFLILVCIVTVEGFCSKGHYNATMAEYESLIFQLENRLYDYDVIQNTVTGDNFNVSLSSKKALYDDVKEFNSNVAYHKTMERNIFIGWFYGHGYTSVPLINLNDYFYTEVL